MTLPVPLDPPQTPGQSAVRWHGLVLGAVLAASVPLVHIIWHGVLGHAEPVLRVRSQTAAPHRDWATLSDGSWMLAMERHLREASPVVWWLRGSWNELLLRIGLPQSEPVCVGTADWLFLREEVAPSVERFRAGAAARQRVFAAVRDRVRAAGAELMVMVVPDKSRIHPERAYADGVVAAEKAPIYGLLLDELRHAGILTADLVQGMQTARAASPAEPLYYRGDTHWRPQGALAGAQAVAAALAADPISARLQPRRALRVGALTSVNGVGDLAALLAIGTAELPDATGTPRTAPLSLLARRYVEALDFYAIDPVQPEPPIRLDGKDPAAEVLLVGTSYSEVSGHRALQLVLGRSIRMLQENGAAGLSPMRAALQELADPAMPRPKLVIWEIVERGFFEAGWQSPRF